jgi:hypothetical protein
MNRIVPVVFVLACVAGCQGPDPEPPADAEARPVSPPEEGREQVAKRVRAAFSQAGRKGLAGLAQHPDPAVSLHAAWETAKGDKGRTDKFAEDRFRRGLQVDPPGWWRECLKSVTVYEANCHSVSMEGARSNAKPYAGLTHGRYKVQSDPSCAGFSYDVWAVDREGAAEVWRARVWAANRNVLAGVGVHRVEPLVSGDRLFVFGAEGHGVYAEAFRLADGQPLLRFCSCYWFDFSERWGL